MKQLTMNIGDWVKGVSINDERFRGYVEWISAKHDNVKVRVTQSDHIHVIGKVIHSQKRKLSLLADESFSGERWLQDLIDVALISGDRNWFIELSNELQQLRNDKEVGLQESDDQSSYQSER